MISPIQGLPVELLTQIFAYCIFDIEGSDKRLSYLHSRDPSRSLMYYPFYPTPLPFLLSHVCVTWRAVVLSTPNLWAFLEVPSSPRDVPFRKLANFIRLWISRSGNSPLSVQASAVSGGNNDGRQHLMKLLANDAHRLTSVVMTFWRTPIPFTETYVKAPEAPLLRVLKLEAKGTSIQQLEFPFSTCPALRELEWPRPALLLTSEVGIPFGQLTYLKLDNVRTYTIGLFLNWCPRLVEIHLNITAALTSSSGHRTIHETLQTMVLTVDENLKIDDAINSILLPNLTLLHIEEIPSSRGLPFPQFPLPVVDARNLRDMLTASGCQLDHLVMIFLEYHSDDLQIILQTRSCSSLQSLKVIAKLYRPWRSKMDILLSDDILAQLTFPETSRSDRVLCPGLEEIFLMNYGPKTPGALARMVISRLKTGRFRRFEFYPTGGHTRDWQILSLASDGHYCPSDYATS